MNIKRPNVLLRLGSYAEKEYIEKTSGQFDGLTFGANLIESTAGATASLICKLSSKRRLSYYIDPMTYAYGTYFDPGIGRKRQDLDWIKSDQKNKGRQFKRSYKALGERFGGAFENAIASSLAIDSAATLTTASLHAVLKYQEECIPLILQEEPDLKDLDLTEFRPAALLTPYFYQEPFSPTFGLEDSLDIIKRSTEYKTDIPIHAVVCSDAKYLENDEYVQSLIRGLNEIDPEGIWLWFSKFDEYSASENQLRNFRKLVEGISESRIVVNMHGSFFSLALAKIGLTAIMHGVGYGEQKDVVPVIGLSTPTVSYYLPPGRKRLAVPLIERSLKTLGINDANDFHEQICKCAICKGVINGNINNFSDFGDKHHSSAESRRQSQTPAAAKRCRYHFLLKRILERDEVAKSNVADIVRNLRDNHSKWGKAPLLREQLSHLARWANVLA